MILPELALRVGAARGVSGRHRMRMEAQRKIHEDQLNPVTVLLMDRLHGVLGALAERALKVRELDHRDGRIFWAERGMPGSAHVDIDARRLEQDLGAAVFAQPSYELLVLLLSIALAQRRDQAILDLVVRTGGLDRRNLVLVLVVKLF